MDGNIYVYINGAKTSLLSLAASSGISYATILARYKAGVAPESLTAGAKAVLDTVPTDGSTNGITSGAVFTAVQSLASDISGLDTDKIDKVSGATAGHAAIMTAAGGLADAGYWPLRMHLLWTNASPDSAFAAQTISLDLTNYQFLIISVTRVYRDTQSNVIVQKNGFPCAMTAVYWGSQGGSNTVRQATASNTGVVFSNAMGGVAYYCIPQAIYGIKGVG